MDADPRPVSFDDLKKVITKIQAEYGCDLPDITEIEKSMKELENKIAKIPLKSPVTLVCGTTGVGKSTMLSFLYDEKSLLINPFRDDQDFDDSVLQGHELTEDQMKQFETDKWIVLDTASFRVGHTMASATLLPSFENIKTHGGGSILCFDLAGFGDNRGFFFKVVVDVIMKTILERFTFTNLICLCSAAWFKERTNAQAIADLKETIVSIGLESVLQLVIVRHSIPPPKQVNGKRQPLSYDYYLEQCRLSTIPNIADNSNNKMAPKFIEAYQFFIPYIEKALFLSYTRFAKETRNDMLRLSVTAKPVPPAHPFSFNPSTIREMRYFFEDLIALMISPCVSKINELRQGIDFSNSSIETRKESIKEKEELLGKLHQGILQIGDLQSNVSEAEKKVEIQSGKLTRAVEQLEGTRRNKDLWIMRGEDRECLGSERSSIKYSYTFSVNCNSDSIEIQSYNNDNYKREDETQTEAKSSVRIINNNWIQNADIEVRFMGKRKYAQGWKNDLQDIENKINSALTQVGAEEVVLADLKKALDNARNLVVQAASIPNTIKTIEGQLVELRKEKTAWEGRKEKFESFFKKSNQEYYDLAFKHLNVIKNSTLYEDPMTKKFPEVYKKFFLKYEPLAQAYNLQ